VDGCNEQDPFNMQVEKIGRAGQAQAEKEMKDQERGDKHDRCHGTPRSLWSQADPKTFRVHRLTHSSSNVEFHTKQICSAYISIPLGQRVEEEGIELGPF